MFLCLLALRDSAVESTPNASHAKTQLKLSQSVARCGKYENHVFHTETTKLCSEAVLTALFRQDI